MGVRIAAVLLARWKRVAIALLVFWAVVTYFFIAPLRCGGTGSGEGGAGEEAAELEARLRAVSGQLQSLREQHHTLLAQIRASRLNGNIESLDDLMSVDIGPSMEYESVRRRVYSDTKELWYYVSNALTQTLKEVPPPAAVDRLHAVLAQLEDRKSVLLAEQQRLWAVDGQREWREREAAAVADLVQRRLHALQHPQDCASARKVVCNLNKGCGFGCQLHHLAYCLIYAYATERTLVLNSRGWRYHSNGWETVFRPLSDSCVTYPADAGSPHLDSEAKVVTLPFIDSIVSRPKFLPLAVPKDIGERVLRFNGDPSSWWVGQMLRYILKPQPHLAETINRTIQRINYRTPIVGVHIRRTDKVGTEAAFHHIHEYMKHVQQYWRVRDLALQTRTPRRVYLASDDPKALVDARSKYPDVEFLGDPAIARAAATHRRYTPDSLTGLLVDLTLLARADFLVCTFSSQVGRVAYELMQANRADASDAAQSLDDIYYFGGQNQHNRVALRPHSPATTNEIVLKTGDVIAVAGNHWDGFGAGHNHRTGQSGLWPWYKTVDQLQLYPFPTYPHVPLKPPQNPAVPPDRLRALDLANFLPTDIPGT